MRRGDGIDFGGPAHGNVSGSERQQDKQSGHGHKGEGVLGRDPVQKTGEQSAEHERRRRAQTKPGDDQFDALANHHPENAAAGGAQRDRTPISKVLWDVA